MASPARRGRGRDVRARVIMRRTMVRGATQVNEVVPASACGLQQATWGGTLRAGRRQGDNPGPRRP